jgi:hypothetical protein
MGVRIGWAPVIGAVPGGLAVSACASHDSTTASTPAVSPTTTVPTHAHGLVPADRRISDRIALSKHRVVAGGTISGYLVVTSRASAPINLTKECEPSFQVVVTDRSVRQEPAFDAMCTDQPLMIQPGANRFPVTVTATYFECGQPGATPRSTGPVCGPDGPPPLPACSYRPIVVGSGDLALPEQAPVGVTLT